MSRCLFGELVVLVTLVCLTASCGNEGEGDGGGTGDGPAGKGAGVTSPEGGGPAIQLTDVLGSSGITWEHQFIDTETGTTYRLNPYDHGSGCLVADVNGDRHDDILFLNFLGDNGLFLGDGQGSFSDATQASGLAMPRAISVGGCFGDYDNDGDQDLYVTTYRSGNHLFRNRGDGTFEDVTAAAGVAYVGHSNSATFFDHDLDGNLDLYLTNIGGFTEDVIEQQAFHYVGVALDFEAVAADTNRVTPGEKNVLWRNRGDGTFEDVTDRAGVGSPSWNGDCSVWDYDGDGDPDLYVANMFGPNNLYRNNGDGTFTDVADQALGRTTWGAIGCRFFDADNDGQVDLYVVDMHSDMWTSTDDASQVDPTAKYLTPFGGAKAGRLGRPITGDLDKLKGDCLFGNSFFHNQGDGSFQEISDQAGLESFWPWGIAVADLDSDGLQDVFLPSGMSYPYYYWPNALYHNQGGLKFTDVATRSGVEPRPGGNSLTDLVINDVTFHRSSRTAAVLDMDHDGDLDLVVNNFNDVPFLYRNDSAPKQWVALRLTGGQGNTSRDAVGSVVTVTQGDQLQVRTVENATGYLAQSTRVLYFGLGSNGEVDKVTVRWAGGEEVDVTSQVEINAINEITQD